MFDYAFDAMANYNNYFPSNNAKIIVGKLKFVKPPKKKSQFGDSPKKNKNEQLSHFKKDNQ